MNKWRALALFAEFVIFFGVAILFQGMRGVMRLGGFVASGGPYVIAHPAPGWVWIIPASFLPMLAMFFVHLFLAGRTGAFPMVIPFWSGLFLSLGYNFLEFTFAPPAGMGFPWGWLVCGVLFVLMGAAPVVWAGAVFAGALRRRRRGDPPLMPEPVTGAETSRLFLLLQLAVMPAAVAAAVWAFRAVSR